MMKERKIEKAIFMIGMPRSGTSVISEAMSLHEELGWLSNWLNAFPSCYWLSVLNRINTIPILGVYLRGKKQQDKGMGSYLRKFLPYSIEAFPVWSHLCGDKFLFDYLIGQTATDEERRTVVKFVRLILMWQGKNRFFAKFTGPPRINYLNSIFERPYYIHVVRDPRAVVSSLLNIAFWKKNGLETPWWRNGLPEDYLHEWVESGKSPTVLAAIQWKHLIEVAYKEREHAGTDRYIVIKYEDFASAPHKWLSRLFQFAGLSDSKTANAYLNSIGKIKNTNYKFRVNLSLRDIALIERTTHIAAKTVGYDF